MTESQAKGFFVNAAEIYRRDNAAELEALKLTNDTLIVDKALELWKNAFRSRDIDYEKAAIIVEGVVTEFKRIKANIDSQKDPLAPKTKAEFDALYSGPVDKAIEVVILTAGLEGPYGPSVVLGRAVDTLWNNYQSSQKHPSTEEVYAVILDIVAPYSKRFLDQQKLADLGDTLTPAAPKAAPPPEKKKPMLIVALILIGIGVVAVSYLILRRK